MGDLPLTGIFFGKFLTRRSERQTAPKRVVRNKLGNPEIIQEYVYVRSQY